MQKPFVGIGINNWQGIRIFTLMSYNGKGNKDWECFNKIICTIHHPDLMPGDYFLKISVNIDGIEQDVIHELPAFEIIPHDYFRSGRFLKISQGLIVKDAKWNYIKTE